ncbi:glycosyltransferase family 2 protein [Mesorhizobium sp. B2-7-1]|uniref:glycosyltransferase family 2 protein n=1 Tax=Mesorhizobium sp. B2-7-1 TaxID=2589909 RepID=UPI001127DCAF|nr:glycosyltransferase family 2 protein [Mesorhizobium sp. B2-7-1]TPJ74939.1 glycosyltransferase family 2 protein [Mesorhizobium sp. B2-7-1]
MELTAVISSYGQPALLRTCLIMLERALARAELRSTAIVVMDNGTLIPYRPAELGVADARIVRFDNRHPFSVACNRGAREIPAARYLFLNNDVFLHPEALLEMLDVMRDHEAGIVGARLVLPDDTIQHCGVRFDGGERGPYHQDHGKPSAIVTRVTSFPQAVTGAAMVIDHAVFTALGGFDEVFPFGYEDADLCLRARQLGVRIACAQGWDSLHLESFSDRRPDRHQASRRLFLERWRGRYAIDGDENG